MIKLLESLEASIKRYTCSKLREMRKRPGILWSKELFIFLFKASGSHYRVHVHHTSMKCTCIDFRMKQSPCKHIYFIVTQVAQNLEILDYFNTTSKISKAAYDILDKQLTQRLKSRM